MRSPSNSAASGLGPVPVYGGLALGVTAVSAAAVLIRLADAPLWRLPAIDWA